MAAQRGFTLVELVMSIVLLSIVATISVQFVVLSTQGAIDTGARQQRALAGAVISEQLSRALRNALPTSVRGSGSCIEWFPIVDGSVYLGLPGPDNPDSFRAVPHADDEEVNGRVVVYGYSGVMVDGYSRDLYDLSDPNPGPISPSATMPPGTGAVTVTLSEPHRFNTQSPQRRFYIVGDPISYCQVGRFLYRYQNYGIASAQATPPSPPSASDREVLAANLGELGSDNFSVEPPTLQRGAVVAFDFVLLDQESGERTNVSQEVQIRNVP